MGRLAQCDGHDAPRLICELVPGRTAMIEEIVVGFEDAVREPVVTHELPDVFDWVELRALWRQRNECDVAWNDKALGHVPTRLVDDQDGMGTGREWLQRSPQGAVHRRGIAIGQYQTPRPCPPSGRRHRKYRLRRCADREERWGRCHAFNQRRVILFFWPMRASSWNEISMLSTPSPVSCATSSRRVGSF